MDPCRGHQYRKKDYTWLVIRYHFPDWLARAILSIYFFRSDRPELLLRIHRVMVEPSRGYYAQDNILSIVEKHTIDQLKAILSSFPASVNDISPSGDSALNFAVGYMWTSAVELLLQAGANPLQESFAGTSAARLAFIMSLTLADNPHSPIHKIVAMMPIFDYLEKDDFTDLHRIVVGWLPVDYLPRLRT